MVVGWQLFNIFVGAVYYYLIVDVVPEPLLGRFYGLFRLFGLAPGCCSTTSSSARPSGT